MVSTRREAKSNEPRQQRDHRNTAEQREPIARVEAPKPACSHTRHERLPTDYFGISVGWEEQGSISSLQAATSSGRPGASEQMTVRNDSRVHPRAGREVPFRLPVSLQRRRVSCANATPWVKN